MARVRVSWASVGRSSWGPIFELNPLTPRSRQTTSSHEGKLTHLFQCVEFAQPEVEQLSGVVLGVGVGLPAAGRRRRGRRRPLGLRLLHHGAQFFVTAERAEREKEG